MLRLSRHAAVAGKLLSFTRTMASITPNVHFDTVAREWRLKWTAENDKASLMKVQEALQEVEAKIKAVNGVKKVQRIVCGGCLDYKVIVALDAADFGAWGESKFAPEEEFLAACKAIPGVSSVETQTYTIMDV